MSENQKMFLWMLILWVSLKVDSVLIRAKVLAPEGGAPLLETITMTVIYSVLALLAYKHATRPTK